MPRFSRSTSDCGWKLHISWERFIHIYLSKHAARPCEAHLFSDFSSRAKVMIKRLIPRRLAKRKFLIDASNVTPFPQIWSCFVRNGSMASNLARRNYINKQLHLQHFLMNKFVFA